ncbi:MAG TPA: hypothetical protein VGA56_01265 [Opitutaceae bacterium]
MGQIGAPTTAADFKESTGRIARHAPAHLIGRDKYPAQLDAALGDPGTHVVTLVAWGGAGKTSLVAHWLGLLAQREWPGLERVLPGRFAARECARRAGRRQTSS